MRIKICGITDAEQGSAIATLGATALGFICVAQSPRYVTPAQLQNLVTALPSIDCIGVFANAERATIVQTATTASLSGIQLHGQESPAFCQQLKQALPDVELIKAFRIRQAADLALIAPYEAVVDALLLDAYHPEQLGGTGHTLDWQALQQFQPQLPWFLAGGLTPENVAQALSHLRPDGIDLSSGVERAPGDKDLARVAQLFKQLQGKGRGEVVSSEVVR
jgi:phosphoribosylanthranilate isomerase